MDAKRLLIVDDDHATCLLFRRIAERDGWSAESVGSARLAQDFVREKAPDLIILDMIMPDMDGIEMVRWLAAQEYRGALILISGFDETYLQAGSTLARAKGIPEVHFLGKPVAMDDLRRLLSRVAGVSEPG